MRVEAKKRDVSCSGRGHETYAKVALPGSALVWADQINGAEIVEDDYPHSRGMRAADRRGHTVVELPRVVGAIVLKITKPVPSGATSYEAWEVPEAGKNWTDNPVPVHAVRRDGQVALRVETSTGDVMYGFGGAIIEDHRGPAEQAVVAEAVQKAADAATAQTAVPPVVAFVATPIVPDPLVAARAAVADAEVRVAETRQVLADREAALDRARRQLEAVEGAVGAWSPSPDRPATPQPEGNAR